MIRKTYSVSDLGLASTLLALGKYKLIELDKADIKKVKFIFEDPGNLVDVATKYWENKIKLPALSLFNNQKVLKNRIYSA